MTSHTIVDSPIGVLTLVAEGDALAGLYLSEQPAGHPPLERRRAHRPHR